MDLYLQRCVVNGDDLPQTKFSENNISIDVREQEQELQILKVTLTIENVF